MLQVSRRFIPGSRFNTAQKRSIITADALTALNSYLPAALSTDFIIPIMALTFGVRCALLPIAYWSQRETAKLLPVIPEIQMLSTFYRKDLSKLPLHDTPGRIGKTQTFIAGARGILRAKGVKPWAIFVPALAQFPPFIFFATQIRQVINPPIEIDPLNKISDGMISNPNLEAAEGMDEVVQDLSKELAVGGWGYISDLTVPDPLYTLPFVFVAIFYGNLELSFGEGRANANSSNFIRNFTSFFQQGSILMLPFLAAVPAGVQIYICTSTSFSILQGAAFRNNSVRSMVGLPVLGVKHEPELYKEHQRELLELSKGGRESLPEGPEGDKIWAQVEKNREDAKELVKGYKPMGHGIMAPGSNSTIKVGGLRESSIDVDENIIRDVPESIMEMANSGEMKGGVVASNPIILPEEDLFDVNPTKRKGAKGGGGVGGGGGGGGKKKKTKKKRK
ncbi:hypothetical protein TL16_g10229 [Triparma laevis f. inornata]|uniref:Membrane insertase YidC/Oxa/ALB C-terminal domain-containing protein n=1 Tax=Triparma laevis f. inornata TaxID=1714386 RepID=A0A9W7EPP1_9STRA|nr:hypothetical protein TL16_g10229 [Triparma laevis f. inornata]